MDDVVKGFVPRRPYHSPRRAERALATRHAILVAARELFLGSGFTATTVAQIAGRAGVSVDTIYATVGRKPALLRELVETAISGTDETVPAEERDYVRRVQDAATAREAIGIYAEAVAGIQQRLAPVFLALRDAALTDPDCAALWTEISQRRAGNMRRLVADLRRKGGLRDDLPDDELADVIWSMNATEYWLLLVVERSWSQDRFARWLNDAWTRLLLADGPTRSRHS